MKPQLCGDSSEVLPPKACGSEPSSRWRTGRRRGHEVGRLCRAGEEPRPGPASTRMPVPSPGTVDPTAPLSTAAEQILVALRSALGPLGLSDKTRTTAVPEQIRTPVC